MQEGKNDGDFAVLVHNAKGCGSKINVNNQALNRRSQSPKDLTFSSEKAARREAIRRYGGEVSKPNNFSRAKNWDQNINLRGPNGQQSEFLKIKDRLGNDISIDHHKWGHVFKDNNTFELPHYQGPNGEHLSYPFRR